MTLHGQISPFFQERGRGVSGWWVPRQSASTDGLVSHAHFERLRGELDGSRHRDEDVVDGFRLAPHVHLPDAKRDLAGDKLHGTDDEVEPGLGKPRKLAHALDDADIRRLDRDEAAAAVAHGDLGWNKATDGVSETGFAERDGASLVIEGRALDTETARTCRAEQARWWEVVELSATTAGAR